MCMMEIYIMFCMTQLIKEANNTYMLGKSFSKHHDSHLTKCTREKMTT